METIETPGNTADGTTESNVMSAAPGKDPPRSNPGATGEDPGDVHCDPRTVTGNAHEARDVNVNDSGNAGEEAPENAHQVVEVPADTPGEAAGSAPAMVEVSANTNGDPAEQPAAPAMKRTPSQAALGLEAAVHTLENKYALSPNRIR